MGDADAGDDAVNLGAELREEARQLAARVRTNLSARARSGALGVPRASRVPRTAVAVAISATARGR